MTQRPRCARLHLEALEDRSMPSVTLLPQAALAPALVSNTTSAAPYVASANLLKPSANSLAGARITFDHSINPATFTPADVVLENSNNQKIAILSVTAVAGSANRTFDVVCTTQTAPGNYFLHIGPNVYDAAGRAMRVFDAQCALAPSAPPPPSGGSSSSAVPIPRSGAGVALFRVDQNVTIQHLQVKLNITYPYDADLVIHVQAPNGLDVSLTKYSGNSGHNFVNTVFDDRGGTWAFQAQAPFSGTYKSTVPLAVLNGTNAHGLWKLWVENHGGHSTGTINSFSVVVN